MDRGGGLCGPALVLRGATLDDQLEAATRLRVERVEELIEVDRRLRLVGNDLAAVIDLRRAVRPRV